MKSKTLKRNPQVETRMCVHVCMCSCELLEVTDAVCLPPTPPGPRKQWLFVGQVNECDCEGRKRLEICPVCL